jgi:hypothetical protein
LQAEPIHAKYGLLVLRMLVLGAPPYWAARQRALIAETAQLTP